MDERKIKVPAYLKIGKVLSYAMYVWVMFGIIVLGLRVFLLAFSANASTPFVDFIYRTSADFLEPFRGIFPPKTVNETGYLDVAALFAIIIYALVGWGFSALINYMQNKIDEYKKAAKLEALRQQQLAARNAQTKSTSQVKRKPATRI